MIVDPFPGSSFSKAQKLPVHTAKYIERAGLNRNNIKYTKKTNSYCNNGKLKGFLFPDIFDVNDKLPWDVYTLQRHVKVF